MTVDRATLTEAVRLLTAAGSPELADLAEILPRVLKPGRDRVKPWQYADVFADARAANKDPKTRCYIRKSTEGDDRQAFTLEAQAEAHDGNIKRLVLPPAVIYVDKASASENVFVEREEGFRLIREVNPGDVVQVTHWDRAFRNVADGLRWVNQWSQTGIRLLILDFNGMGLDFGNPVSTFIITLLAGVAQLESEQNGERQRVANKVRRQRGERMGRFPGPGYCFRKRWIGNKLKLVKVPHLEERKIVAMIQEMRNLGDTVEAIRVELRRKGIRRADTHLEWTKGAIHKAVHTDFEELDALLPPETKRDSELSIATMHGPMSRTQSANAGVPVRSAVEPPKT